MTTHPRRVAAARRVRARTITMEGPGRAGRESKGVETA